MTRAAASIDISDMPELVRLAREVSQSGRPRVLRGDNQDLAVLVPPPRTRRRTRVKGITDAQRAAVLASVGAWEGLVDAEQLKRDLDAARGDDRAPVELRSTSPTPRSRSTC